MNAVYGVPFPDDEVVAKREQLLITELLGELVKIRNRGYKTMKQARVDAKMRQKWIAGTLTDTGYVPVFDWEGESRAGQVRVMRRLDVMTERGWATVWDDGMDDIHEWDRGRPSGSAAPTNLKYRAGMLS